jgi:DNA topoisomerase-3
MKINNKGMIIMEKDIIAKCPACGGDVVETQKGYGCLNWREEDGGCRFVIWKQFYDKKITKKWARDLIEKRKTNVIKKWVSRKTGKEFDAALQLVQDEEGKYQVRFLFDE